MMYDPAHGLAANIHQVRRVAWLLRDRISVDAWLILNQLDQQFSAQPPSGDVSGQRGAGPFESRHHYAFRFLRTGDGRHDARRWLALPDIGRRLERAIQMAELLRNSLPKEAFGDVGVLEAMLEMADSSITYRSRYLTSLQADLVLDLLLVDEANPRSIAFQLARLREHIDQLPASQTSIRRPAEARMAISLLNRVQLPTCANWCGRAPAVGGSRGTARRLIADLTQLSETLTRAYFSHAAQSRQLMRLPEAAMKLHATHATRYRYSGVSTCHTEAHLHAAAVRGKPSWIWALSQSHARFPASRHDYFGNPVTLLDQPSRIAS